MMVNMDLNPSNKRSPKRFPAHYGISDQYRYFRNALGNTIPLKYGVNKTLYTKIIRKCNKLVSEMIINEAYDFRLGGRLGYLSVKKLKPKLTLKTDGSLDVKKSILKVDWYKTRELWKSNPDALKNKKVIYYENKHTEGYTYGWRWDKKPSKVKNKNVYSFKATRDNSRAINIALKNNKNIDYFEKI